MNRTPNALAAATPLKDTSPAYPHVQPLKASLFFDSAKGLGDWRIFMSTTAVKDMRTCLRDKKIFKIILKKLRELSTGFFSDDNQKRLQGPSNGIPIFEAKLTNDLRLIYQIDMTTDFERNCETQGIRVYGIFTHAQMDNRMWASLSAQLNVRGSEYRRRPRTSGDNVFLPQSWPDSSITEVDAEGANSISEVNEADRALLHQWLVLEKYSALSTALVNWILSDKDSAPLFSVSPYERDIIEHISSCYVLGRSGTGKTTTMTFKMFGIERTVQMRATELESKPRQLFVTQSRVLASRVKEFYHKFSEFLSSTGIVQSSAAEHEHDGDEGLGDPEDDEDWQDESPKRFSELQEHHFPLFITFEKLCRLLETDLGITLARPRSTKKQKRVRRQYNDPVMDANAEFNDMADEDFDDLTAVGSAIPSKETLRNCLVDFESFQNNYWPHFPQRLTKHLDPALVFSEILGVIKGSEEALHSGNTYLSREAYLSLNGSTRSALGGHRERVYLLFEKYTALKREYGHYDAADRAHAIYRKLEDGYQISVDFLYVDEVQDNLIADALLLRRLCCNPHGLFWAGDTAQTIATGSSFRFNELKASLYRLERHMYPSASECLVQPEFFQLTTNYRSHGGIVDCAGLIIELITYFWPYSIDALQKERGIVEGPKPIFFTGWNNETARYDQFLRKQSGNSIEFGAQQCILVRNNRARQELRTELGDKVVIILTLYESKGLEFDDVFLYDFFEDSPCNLSQWRVVLNFMPYPERDPNPAPLFDELLHTGVCTELKCLYVAITRARKNLWIIDRSEKGQPMKTLLLRDGKIEIRSPENAPSLAVNSTPKEWATTGKLLFQKQRYLQAMDCFVRAGRPRERDIAKAYYLRQEARNIPRSRGERARSDAYLEAGSAFLTCAESVPTSGRTYYHISAECFREARDYGQAARSYEYAQEYNDAAKCYAKATNFEDAMRIVKTRVPIDRDTIARITGTARLHYVHGRKLKKAMELELFDSPEELLEYLEDYGFETTRAEVLKKVGRIQEAADIYFREGHESQAISDLLDDAQNPKSLERAAQHLLTCLWHQYSFGLDPKQREVEGIDPFHHFRKMDEASLPKAVLAEFNAFDAIKRDDRKYMMGAYAKFLGENRQAAILILDYLLAHGYDIDGVQGAIQYLQACLVYAKNLRMLWIQSDPMAKERTQRLFAVRRLSEDEFLLPEGTFLAGHVASSQPPPSHNTDSRGTGIVLGPYELLRAVRSSVATRLSEFVKSQANIFSEIRKQYLGDPCLNHTIRGSCAGCNRQHIDLKSVDIAWFNGRVQMILLQLLFLREASFAVRSDDLRWTRIARNDCLTDLFGTLNPPLLALGSMAVISREYVRELADAVDAVSYWVENRLYGIYPEHLSKPWILNAVTEVTSLSAWRDKDRARKLLTTWSNTGGMARSVHGSRLEQSGILALIRCLDLSDPEFLKLGNSFIRNITRLKLRIDISYVCHLIELLSAAVVLLYKYRRPGGFHHTLLPRSWLLLAMPRLDFVTTQRGWLPVKSFIEDATGLARYLLTGTDGEHLRGASAYAMRTISVLRICRAISLVAYNMNKEVREHALHGMIMLQKASAGLGLDFTLKPYILSRFWSELRQAAECSVSRSNLDCMVQLVQEGYSPRLFSSSATAVPIWFKNRDDLFTRIFPSRKVSDSKLSATAKVFVPGSVNSLSTSAIDAINKPIHVDGNGIATANEDSQTMEDSDNEDDSKDIMDEPMEPLDLVPTTKLPKNELVAGFVILYFLRRVVHNRKDQAVRRIQRWIRAIRTLWKDRDLPGLRGNVARFHKVCVDADRQRSKEWTNPRYRFLFLGIIPKLLACMDVLQRPIQSNKDRARKQLSLKPKDKSIDYEEVHLRISQANTMKRRFEELRQEVREMLEGRAEPTLQGLREFVDNLIALFDELKVVCEERDMCLEIRELIRERKPRPYQKKPRPALNTSDLDGMYYDDQE